MHIKPAARSGRAVSQNPEDIAIADLVRQLTEEPTKADMLQAINEDIEGWDESERDEPHVMLAMKRMRAVARIVEAANV